MDIEGAAEEEGEAEDVVDLVGVVRAAGGHHVGLAGHRGGNFAGLDLGVGVGHCEDGGEVGHLLDVLASEHVSGGDADEDVRADEGLLQGALVGGDGVAALVVGEVGAVGADDALGVAHCQVLHAGGLAHIGNTNAGGPGAVHHHLDVLEGQAGNVGVVDEPGHGDDRGAPLVVVEDGDVELGVEDALNLEAGGGGDVLEVDAAIHRGEGADGLDDALGVGLAGVGPALAAVREGHRPGIDVGEGLEERGLALHHRDGRQGAEVAQTEDGRAVGDHGHEVALARQREGGFGLGGDFLDRLGHAGRIGQAQILLGFQRLRERYAHLSALVKREHFFLRNLNGHCSTPWYKGINAPSIPQAAARRDGSAGEKEPCPRRSYASAPG